MAVTITKTVGELFAYTGFKACQVVYQALYANNVNWSEDDVWNVLTWTEGLRGLGLSSAANDGLYRALTQPQKLTFLNWALDQLIAITPNGYSGKPTMIAYKAGLVDYVVAPTPQKEANIRAAAKALRPNPAVVEEIYIVNIFKGVAYALVNNALTNETMNDLGHSIVKAAVKLSGSTSVDVNNAILTQLQIVIGIRDP